MGRRDEVAWVGRSALAGALVLAMTGCPERRADVDAPPPGAVPLMFQPLFDRTLVMVYRWHHGGENDRLECRAHDVRRWQAIWAATWRCRDLADDPDAAADGLGLTWVASPAGLWRVGSMPADETAANAVVTGAPYLPAEPVDVMDEHAHVRREALGEDVVWCRSDRPSAERPEPEELCFDPARGVLERTVFAADGAPAQTLRLLSPGPLAPP